MSARSQFETLSLVCKDEMGRISAPINFAARTPGAYQTKLFGGANKLSPGATANGLWLPCLSSTATQLLANSLFYSTGSRKREPGVANGHQMSKNVSIFLSFFEISHQSPALEQYHVLSRSFSSAARMSLSDTIPTMRFGFDLSTIGTLGTAAPCMMSKTCCTGVSRYAE